MDSVKRRVDMADYTNEYSKLPNEIMTLHHFKDVNNSVAVYVNQINNLKAQGKFAEAQAIISAHPELKSYILSAEYINAIDEETRNLEILELSKKQSIYYQTSMPKDAIHSDVWIE
jgi:hypothetical protein